MMFIAFRHLLILLISIHTYAVISVLAAGYPKTCFKKEYMMTGVTKSLRVVLLAVLIFGISGVFLQVSAENKIDVNTATAEQLSEIKGIGPVIAKRIVDYRQENGRFTNKEQLQEIKGIGPATLSKIEERITLATDSD